MPLPVIESETNLNPALWGLQLPKGSGQPIKAISNIDKSYPDSSSPGQNGCHSQAIILDVFSWMKLFVLKILIEISLKFVPKGPIDNTLALF